MLRRMPVRGAECMGGKTKAERESQNPLGRSSVTADAQTGMRARMHAPNLLLYWVSALSENKYFAKPDHSENA